MNSLDLQAIKIGPLQPLRKSRLSQYIDARYIDWINSNIQIKKMNYSMKASEQKS